MRSLGTRRVAQAAGAAMVAVIALAGCSAGQVAETAILKAPISGLNTESPDGGLQIRNLQVIYNKPTGYAAHSNAPLEISLFNQTQRPLTVTITSKLQQNVVEGVVSASDVGVGAFSTASPSAGASSSLTPAKFTIAPLSTETFLPGDTEALQAVDLSGPLTPGHSLILTVEVSTTGQTFDVLAPFGIPLSPASRAPGISHENSEE